MYGLVGPADKEKLAGLEKTAIDRLQDPEQLETAINTLTNTMLRSNLKVRDMEAAPCGSKRCDWRCLCSTTNSSSWNAPRTGRVTYTRYLVRWLEGEHFLPRAELPEPNAWRRHVPGAARTTLDHGCRIVHG